jgi:hypothetical protein
MTQYVGLDVSLKETKLHVLDEAGNRIGVAGTRLGCCDRCSSASVRSNAVRIGLETGPLTTWLWTALTADARHALGNGGGSSLHVEVRNSIQPNTQRHNAISRAVS